jgi:hypothetical protein
MENEQNPNPQPEPTPPPEAVTKVKPPIKTLKVIVTAAEIACSVKGASKHCMITDAIKRDYGRRFTKIITDKEATAFTERKTGRRYKFSLTPLARGSLLKFDNGEAVTPFEFKLKDPIVRERRAHVKTGKTMGVFKKGGAFGASGAVAGANLAKGSARRVSRGIDRLFGSRVFKTELDALRNQLAPMVTQ